MAGWFRDSSNILFGFGMEAIVDFFKMRVGNVSIDLGGGDIGVAKHGLDGAQVGAVHEKVGSEAVAEGVWGNVLGDAGHFGVFLDDALNRASGEPAVITGGINGLEIFAVIKKKGIEGINADGKIITDAVGGGFGDEDRAVFVAFATDDKLAAFEVDGIAIELDKFGDAKPTGIK